MFDGLVHLTIEIDADLVVVGPEAPLVLGLADQLRARDIPTFGPSADAARIEGSKSWANDVMNRYGIPCPESHTFNDADPPRSNTSKRVLQEGSSSKQTG